MSTHKLGKGRNTYTLSLGTVCEPCDRCKGRGSYTEGDPPVVHACGCLGGKQVRKVWRLFDRKWRSIAAWEGAEAAVVARAREIVKQIEAGRKSRMVIIPPLAIPVPEKKKPKKRTMSKRAREKRQRAARIRQAIAACDERQKATLAEDHPLHPKARNTDA